MRSCLIDGEAIVCDGNGLAVFDLIRGHRAVASAVHCAFDLLELNGKDLRWQPIEERKRARAHPGVEMELIIGNRIAAFQSGRFDVAIMGRALFANC